jgi:hypothetical protein
MHIFTTQAPPHHAQAVTMGLGQRRKFFNPPSLTWVHGKSLLPYNMLINTAASFMDIVQKYLHDMKTIRHIPKGSSGQGLVDQGHSTNKNVLCLHAGCIHAHKTTKHFPWIIWPISLQRALFFLCDLWTLAILASLSMV